MLTAAVLLAPATIPSPEQSVWYLGPFPLRAYALCIVAGVIVCLWLTERRFRARGAPEGATYDIAVWAIPFGLVGARLYHVLSSPDAYFGPDGSPMAALYIWQGGLGIWGAVALGGVGAWIGARRAGLRLPPFADALAPGLVLAQAIGRWGNWFNQELYGKATDLPWGLHITDPKGLEPVGYYHPTFLYECLWNLAVAALVLWADRRYRLGHGRAFALYVAAYTLGRLWIEALRIDDAEMIGPFRLNVWTSLIVCALAVVYLVMVGRLRPGREDTVYRPGHEPAPDTDSDGAAATPVGADSPRGAAPARPSDSS